MRITHKAAKVWEPETTTTEPCPSAHGIIANAIRYRARGRGSISGEYEIVKAPPPKPSDGSIWGWANQIHWSSNEGYFSAEDDDTTPWSPPPPDDE